MKGWGISLVRFNNFFFLKGIYLNYTTTGKNNRNTLVYSRYVFLPRKTNLVERSIIEAKAINFNGFQQSCQNCSHLKLFGILIYWDWNIYSQILCENGCSKLNTTVKTQSFKQSNVKKCTDSSVMYLLENQFIQLRSCHAEVRCLINLEKQSSAFSFWTSERLRRHQTSCILWVKTSKEF